MATADLTERYQVGDGFKLAYRHWKAINPKRVLVCIHGVGDYSGWFRNLAPQLAVDGSDVYAFDLRGFGESQQPGSPRGHVGDFNRHLQDIDDFIQYLRGLHRGKKLFVLGHSLGGVYSIWYAAHHISKVDGLVLCAPAIVCSLEDACLDKNRDPEEIKIMLDDPLETWQLSSNYLSGVKEVLLKPVLKNAYKIQIPTLILQGKADVTVKAEGANLLFEALPVADKQLTFFDDAGHWFYDALSPTPPRSKIDVTKMKQFVGAIRDWLLIH